MIRLFVVLYLKGSVVYRRLVHSISTLPDNALGTRLLDSSAQIGVRVRQCFEEFNMDDDDDALKWNKGLNLNAMRILKELDLSFSLGDAAVDS